MPIEVSTEIRACDQETFQALDREIMGIVFALHNDFGRLLDEDLYKKELARRCLASRIEPVEREVRIRVTHENFAKHYFMDLLLRRGSMFEAKAVERLTSAHRTQALNYLLLAGLRHGRLVNFRTQRVQHEFVSTSLTLEERRRFNLLEDEWAAINAESRYLKVKMLELLQDWGGFLEIALYREALVHFLGGPAAVSKPVQIYSEGEPIGTQNLNLISSDTAFAITAKRDHSRWMRDHFERLLGHTSLEAIQWINLDGHVLEFTTIRSVPRNAPRPEPDGIMAAE